MFEKTYRSDKLNRYKFEPTQFCQNAKTNKRIAIQIIINQKNHCFAAIRLAFSCSSFAQRADFSGLRGIAAILAKRWRL